MKKIVFLHMLVWSIFAERAGGQTPPKFVSPTPVAGAEFGAALVTAGDFVLIGAPGENAAYLFNAQTRTHLRTFRGPEAGADDRFGVALAIAGEVIVIGAPLDDLAAPNAGAVYLFDLNTGAPLDTLVHPEAMASDDFGQSVAAAGNQIIAGIPNDEAHSEAPRNHGAIYIFDRVTGEEQIIDNPDEDTDAHFGTALAVVGNNLLVGTPSDGDGEVSSFGSVTVVELSTGQILRTILNPLLAGDPAGSSNNGFGQALANAGTDFVAGAPFNENAAAVYLMNLEGGAPLRTYASPRPGPNNRFGFAVASSGPAVLVGAPFETPDTLVQQGRAYLFERDSGALIRTLSIPNLGPGTPSLALLGTAVAFRGNDLLAGAPNADNTLGAVYIFPQQQRPPVISPIAALTMLEGTQLTVPIVATDPDNNNLTLTPRNLPVFASFSDSGNGRGAVRFRPDLSSAGDYPGITIIATDDGFPALSDTTLFTLTVLNAASTLVLNEILYDPNYDDLGHEKIEIINAGTTPFSLVDLFLLVQGNNSETSWAFPDCTLAPGALMTVHWLAVGQDDGGNLFTGLPGPGSRFFRNNSTIAENMQLGGPENDQAFTLSLTQFTGGEFPTEERLDFAQFTGRVPAQDTVAQREGLWEAGTFLSRVREGVACELKPNALVERLTLPRDFFMQSKPSIGFRNAAQASPAKHLLISEICVRPRLGEFVEIFNATDQDVLLGDFYLTDNVTLNDNAYTLLTKGQDSLRVDSGDFLVRFPATAFINRSAYQTVAFRASTFMARYGQKPTYEIIDSDPSVVNMEIVKLGTGTISFNDPNEAAILFSWDRASDLVEDVDYVVWGKFTPIDDPPPEKAIALEEESSENMLAAGPLNESIDKTGLGLDGMDTLIVRSYYDPDTHAPLQIPVDSLVHEELLSWQRPQTPREFGERNAGGNGLSGHDETSEDLFEAFSADTPTPNAPNEQLDLAFDSDVFFGETGFGPPNGVINPAETIKLAIQLRNNGDKITAPLFTVLRSADPFVSIGTDSTDIFEPIPPQGTQLSLGTYDLVARDTLLPPELAFVLRVVEKNESAEQLVAPQPGQALASAVKEIFIRFRLPGANVNLQVDRALVINPTPVGVKDTLRFEFRLKYLTTRTINVVPPPQLEDFAVMVSLKDTVIISQITGPDSLFLETMNPAAAPTAGHFNFALQNSFAGQPAAFDVKFSWRKTDGTFGRDFFTRTFSPQSPFPTDSLALFGKVKYYQGGRVLSGAQVTLKHPGGQATATTDSLGQYRFKIIFPPRIPPPAKFSPFVARDNVVFLSCGMQTTCPCTLSVSYAGVPGDSIAVTVCDVLAALPLSFPDPSPDTPYRFIAADVDQDPGQITCCGLTSDVKLIEQKALNPTLPAPWAPREWSFVDSLFPIDNFNWREAPATIMIKVRHYNLSGLNAIGVYLGDVDGRWHLPADAPQNEADCRATPAALSKQ
ncbi:MAG: hypothetical protein ACREOO_14490 [bacterium]